MKSRPEIENSHLMLFW